MTTFRVRFEGPADLVVRVATALADADGVELIRSDPHVSIGERTVELHVEVDGAFDAVADAVAGIRAGIPVGSSLDITDG